MGRRKVYDLSKQFTRPDNSSKYGDKDEDVRGGSETLRKREITEHHFKGYTDCGCNAGWRPGVVLDCFCGKLHNRQGGRKAAA